MKNRTLILGLLALFLSALFPSETTLAQCPENYPALTPAPLEESWAIEWWMPRHNDKLNEDGRENAEILLIGDSITHGWENTGKVVWEETFGEYPTYNIGYSGDRTENVLWRFEHGEIDGIRPKVAVLMIGTNNTGHRQDPADCTAEGIRQIVQQLNNKLPDTHLILLAIFPTKATPEHELRILNEDINRQIETLGNLEQVTFLNLNHHFLTDEGILTEEIMPDLLHPNETGYRIWAEALHPVLMELLD